MLVVRPDGERVSFAVRLTPRAAANAVAGERDGALLVRVTAPPVEGRANDALVVLLAKALDLPRGAVRVEQGTASRMKRVSVTREAVPALRRLTK